MSVLVAMSGGVDSSVAAGLLVEQGYHVEGFTLDFIPPEHDKRLKWSCGLGAVNNARSVCKSLGIKHHIINCSDEFEQAVLRPAWNDYQYGKTPSPCINCNSKIKFKIMLDRAGEFGADMMATGHYAIVTHGKNPTLSRGEYTPKDQTYFLFALSKKQLNFTMFPLAGLSKPRVRELAQKMGFENAKRAESQDSCFVTDNGGFSEALRIKFNGGIDSGDLFSSTGVLLGRHKGISNYTIGQRKGLGIALGKKAYVSKIDAQSRSIVLTTSVKDILSKGLIAHNVSWTGDVEPLFPLNAEVQIRYRSKPVVCTADFDKDRRLVIKFETEQMAVTPGQAAVLYDKDRVLGGGWIVSSL